MNKAQKLRQLLREKPILKVMGGHNALGAKLIEKNGFDAVWASGLEISAANGVPDANILTMTENLDASMRINDATVLPVLCDCDTGYGNASNVMHMIRKYEAAGMAAVVIEDKHFPKVNSFIPGRQELTSIEEFKGKLEAAVTARSSSDGIMIFARIEALIAGWGMDEALARAKAYYESGADGLVIHSKSKTPEEIFTFMKLWTQQVGNVCPVIAIPTTYYQVTAKELAQVGFKVVIYANQGIRAQIKSMDEVFRQISEEGSSRSVENRIAPLQEVFHLQGMLLHQENERRYSPKSEKIAAVIPAAADHQFQPELASYLKDIPLCMLDIGGKTLLDRQLDILRSVGVRDFTVVTGYQGQKIQASGIQKVENLDYKNKGSLVSLMCGLAPVTGRTIICYADIIFDRLIPQELLKSKFPITLVIDRAFDTLPRRDKMLDKVACAAGQDSRSIRKMELEQYKRIKTIGKKIDSKKADHEFVGMMLLSQEGMDLFKSAWKEAQVAFKAKPFYEAKNIETASVTDFLQYLIDKGIEIGGLVIEHGWSEIYSLDDYERINRYFSNPASPKPTDYSPVSL